MLFCEVAKSELANSQLVEQTNLSNGQTHRTDELAKSQLVEPNPTSPLQSMLPLPNTAGHVSPHLSPISID